MIQDFVSSLFYLVLQMPYDIIVMWITRRHWKYVLSYLDEPALSGLN